MSSSTISLLGSDVHYWTLNPAAARCILMVHGFRGNHIALLRIAEGLEGFRVVVPDLPGYGASTPMTQTKHDVDGYVELVKAFIVAMGLEKPVLLGESFGSVIASRLAASEPGLTSELILVNPIAASPREVNRVLCGLEEAYYWLGVSLPEPLAGRVLASRTVNRLESLALVTARDASTRRAVFRQRLHNVGLPQHRRVIAESFPDSIKTAASEAAESILQRTLLIAGERDALSPVTYQRRLHQRLPRSTLRLVPHTGHFLPLEKPAEVAGAIAEFLG